MVILFFVGVFLFHPNFIHKVNSQSEVSGVTITFRNETVQTSVFSIYVTKNTERIGGDKLVSSILSPGETYSFKFPRGKYYVCIESRRKNVSDKKNPTIYRSLFWRNQSINSNIVFTIDTEAWTTNTSWTKASCFSSFLVETWLSVK